MYVFVLMDVNKLQKKLHLTITIDVINKEKFESIVGLGNISKEINKLIENYIGLKNYDVESNKQTITEAIEQNKKELQDKAADLTRLQSQLVYINKLESDERLRLAEEIKQKELEAKKCVLCSSVISELKNAVKMGNKGLVCKSCYYDVNNKKDIKRLTNEGIDEG